MPVFRGGVKFSLMFDSLKKTITESGEYKGDPFVKSVSDKFLSRLDGQINEEDIAVMTDEFRKYLQSLLSASTNVTSEQAHDILGDDYYDKASVLKLLDMESETDSESTEKLLPYSEPTLHRARGKHILVEGVPVSTNELFHKQRDLYVPRDGAWFEKYGFANTRVSSIAMLINSKTGFILNENHEITPPSKYTEDDLWREEHNRIDHDKYRGPHQAEFFLAHAVTSLRKSRTVFEEGEIYRTHDVDGMPGMAQIMKGKLWLGYNEDA